MRYVIALLIVLTITACAFRPNTDAAGTPVLLSIGMSNATRVWCGGDRATTNCEPESLMGKVNNPGIKLVNGASGGAALPDGTVQSLGSEQWAIPNGVAYTHLDARLALYGVSASQVKVIWMYNNRHDGDVTKLAADLNATLNILKGKFPNLKRVYLQGGEYRGWSTNPLRTEPASFQTWGEIDKVVALWAGNTLKVERGPYWWNASDPRDYFVEDGYHPSKIGVNVRSNMLLTFFSAQSWWPTTVQPTATKTPTPRPTATPSSAPQKQSNKR